MSELTQLSREAMTALSMAQLTAPCARRGELTVLAFARPSRYLNQLYALLPELARHYRAVAEDPVRAFVAERHYRYIWSRLVARSSGYWLNGRGLQRFTDA